MQCRQNVKLSGEKEIRKMVDQHDIEVWADDVKKAHKTVEEIWQDKCPDDVDKAVMDALEALETLKLKLCEYM